MVSEDINDNIVAYNNRVAEARRKYEAEQRRIAEEVARRAAEEAERMAAEPQEWSGTGFALNKGYVVTNYHVIEDAKHITVTGVLGSFQTEYNAKVVATDVNNDIAIIKIEDNRFKGFGTIPYNINLQMAEVGDDIFVLGYPLTQTMGDEIKLTNGIISSRTGFQGDVSLYQMSAPVQPGNSGGPLFDYKGNVIGIVCAQHEGTENVGYAIKTSYLKKLAESSSLSNCFPKNNTVSSLSLSGKVKKLENFVFQIKCSNQTIGSSIINKDNNDRWVDYPTITNKLANDLTVVRVTLSSTYTSIEIRSRYSGYDWCNIDRNTYISANGEQKKLVQAVGINISPYVTYYYQKDITFTLYFPPIPFTTTQIDLIEPGGSV